MAATTIDSLVVTLGLDSSEFDKRVKALNALFDKTANNAEETGKKVQESGTKAASFFGQMQSAAIKFFAVLTVGRGLSDFTRTIISTGAQLDRVSGRLGTSTDTLSRWQGAVRQSGGTAEGFLETMQGLSSSLTELRLTGNTGILSYLQALGVSVADANGKAKPLEDILTDIGDKLNALPNKSDAFNIGRNLGIDDGTINLLMKGRNEVSRLLAAQQGYSAEDARAAREAQERWEGVKLRIERTSQAIVIKLLPSLEKLSGAMEKFADKAVPVLTQIIDAFTELDGVTNGWSSTLLICLATLRLITGGTIFGGIKRLAGGFASVAAAAAMLKGDQSESSKNAQELSGRALSGDRNAAVELARQQLSNQWWRSNAKPGEKVKGSINQWWLDHIGGAPTEEEIQARADSIMRGEQGGAVPVAGMKKNSPENPPAGSGRNSEPAPQTTELPLPRGNTRAERNNNPGNLEFRGQLGAEREDGEGRFAKFQSVSDGVAALVKQLQRYGGRGLDSIKEIVEKYAPASENDTQAYIAALTKKLGVGANDMLDLNDPGTLSGLVRGISKHEAGRDFLSDEDILTGLRSAGVAPAQAQGNTTTVGTVNVYTQATDANGIARDIRGAMIRQADTGIR